MNPQQAEQIIIEAVRRVVPEAFELKFGCRVQRYTGTEYITYTYVSNELPPDDDSVRVIDSMGMLYWLSKASLEILGRPLTLADILVTIAETPGEPIYVRADMGVFYRVDSDGYLKSLHIEWNLSLPLSGQSDEVKVFIAKLLQ